MLAQEASDSTAIEKDTNNKTDCNFLGPNNQISRSSEGQARNCTIAIRMMNGVPITIGTKVSSGTKAEKPNNKLQQSKPHCSIKFLNFLPKRQSCNRSKKAKQPSV